MGKKNKKKDDKPADIKDISDDIQEIWDEITDIEDGSTDIKAVVGIVNDVVSTISELSKFMDASLNKMKPKVPKKKMINPIWEYIGFYIVILATVTFTFFYDDGVLDENKFWQAAAVLSGCILVGFVKNMLWGKVEERDATIEDLKQTLEVKNTALNVQSIELTSEKDINMKLISKIREMEPSFSIDALFYSPELPKSISKSQLPDRFQ